MQNTLRKLAKGFTLIELMIVVAIIGILAAIAIPNFVKFQCRSKQGEAKTNLKSMYVAQEGYRAEYDVYLDIPVCSDTTSCGTAGAQVGWTPKGKTFRYKYGATANGTVAATALAFTGSASGTGELQTEGYTVTQLNELTLTGTNACQ